MSGRALRLRVVVAPDQDEALGAWVWTHGGQGLVLSEPAAGRQPAEAFFDAAAAPGEEALADLPRWCPGVELGALEAVEERDWMAGYRAAASPIEIGRRFVVDPREPEEVAEPVDPGGRFLLRLPARTAFGVGSHESTRLALELLEEVGCAGARVLDVGTGTGILAFAARLLGAREVVAFDVDPAAAFLAAQYARLNRLPPNRIFAGSLAALSIAGGIHAFDLALVNVVPAEIGPELGLLAAALGSGAKALFSGILLDEAAAARSELAARGFRVTGERGAAEWIAFVAERVG